MARLSPIAALAAALAIVTAGCASAGASGPGGVDGAAKIVPADAVSFVAATTDLSSSQWHGLGQFAIGELRRQTKLDWGADVQPLIGDELDVALLPGKKAVALVQPTDDAKFAAFVKKHGCATRTFGEWTAVARDAATLDAVAAATSHLADSSRFLEAMERLPNGALVRAYANGDEANTLFASIPGQLEARLLPTGARYRVVPRHKAQQRSAGAVGVQEFRWLAASLVGTDSGLKLEAVAPLGELAAAGPPRLAVKPIAPYTSGLVDEIPAGVLAVADFQVPLGAFELMPQLPGQLPKALGPAAIGLTNQLDAILGGETAVYVRPAFPTPEITLVTQPTDTAAASSTLDDVLRSLPKTSWLAGVKLYRAVIGGEFVVSTTQRGIDDFRGGGAKLSTDASFLEAKKESGMPDQTTGFAYANVKSALPLLALAGVKLPSGLPQLRTFAVFGAKHGNESTLTAFLGVGS